MRDWILKFSRLSLGPKQNSPKKVPASETEQEEMGKKWAAQDSEIQIFLDNEKKILAKVNNDPNVIFEFQKLKFIIGQPKWENILKARETRLDNINKAIIFSCIDRNSDPTKLDCANFCLTRFPESVFAHQPKFWQSLTWLDIGHNQLTALPDNLNVCSNLASFFCNNNRLISLPKILIECKALRAIFANHNCIAKIPVGLNSLPNLLGIYLLDNCLQAIPDTVAQCPSLKKLALNDNYLNSLPNNLPPFLVDSKYKVTNKEAVLRSQKHLDPDKSSPKLPAKAFRI